MLGFEKVEMWWLRGRFNKKERFEFYEKLILLLDNQVLLVEAFAQMFNIYSDDGGKRDNIIAIVSQECEMALSDGKLLSDVLAKWVSYDEASLIAAGEHAGDLQGAFRRVMRLIESKKRITAAVSGAVVYPSLLGLQAVYLLHKIAVELVPKMLRNTKDVESLTGPAYTLKVLADAVVGYGAPALGVLIAVVVIVVATMPVYRGRARFVLDKLPPWSFYRMLHGSTFLLNVGVLLTSGVKLNEALERMAERAQPWLRSRLEDTLYGVNIGLNLGTALHNAGHEFPDKRAIQFLRVVSGKEGAETNIEQFGERWMEESVITLQKMSKLMLSSAIVVNGALMLLVLTGASSMSDAAMMNLQH